MKTLKWFCTAMLICVLQGCVSAAHIPPQMRDQIPKDANAIQLYSDESSAACFDKIYRVLASQGFVILQENKDMGTLATEFKDIGQGTTLKISVFVEQQQDNAIATFRGQWGVTTATAAGLSAGFGTDLGGSTAETAVWGKTGRPKLAFGEMAILANKIEHIRCEYLNL